MLKHTVHDPSGGDWTWYRRSDGKYQVTSVEVPTYGFALTTFDLMESASETMQTVWQDIRRKTIRTNDGKVVHPGDHVYDFYSLKWGHIVDDMDSDGWFHVNHDGGGRVLLNGDRIASYQPEWTKAST